MSRKKKAPIRVFLPDSKFKSMVILKLINSLMYDGRKTTAERIVYKAIDKLKSKSKEEPIKIFNEAINNLRPTVEVRSRRVGGATYQVPVEISKNRKIALAMRWIIQYSKSRKGKTMADRLAAELVAASNNEGSAIKKKEDTHKMAEANKAFAHFG